MYNIQSGLKVQANKEGPAVLILGYLGINSAGPSL
jgi:hypothetical protein